MISDSGNISNILTHFDSVIRREVCKRCYAGTLPATLKEDALSMVVIDVGNSLRDRNALADGQIYISLYAQPLNGQINVPALKELETALTRALREDKFDSDEYSVSREILLSGQGYDTTYNMHYFIKTIEFSAK